MKLFLNDDHKRKAIISFFLSIPLFMWLMPFGSFDPQQAGFWLSILCALIIEIPGNWLLVKIHKKWGKNQNTD